MARADEELGANDLGAWQSFTRDLGASLRAWAKAPLLPLLTVLLGLAQALATVASPESSADLFFLPALMLLLSGWVGTQRIWYLRVWRGRRMSANDVFTFTFRFLWRYLKLGLMGAAILCPFFVLLFAIGGGHTTNAVLIGVAAIVIDFVFTFATPALSYTTAGAGEALSIGMRTLKETWPRSAPYALVPPLAIGVVGQLLPQSILATNARLIYLGVTALVALAFKGAAAAFYLRHHDVGDDGSVFMKVRDQQGTFGTPSQPERPL